MRTLLDYADEQVTRIRAAGCKGWLPAFRDAALLKSAYGYGPRRNETRTLDVADLLSQAGGPAARRPPVHAHPAHRRTPRRRHRPHPLRAGAAGRAADQHEQPAHRPVLDLIPARPLRPPWGIGYEVWATLTSN
ncbi:hypothetical protein [Salinispora arenicola]|uniref:hypothetical protein n=1 Tax=Salinispora arenicola TaxID=168697 RepID=UPI00037C698D|nr:hypothetical protein [Salinispora arenicola]